MQRTIPPAASSFESHFSTLTLEMLLHDLSAPLRHVEFFIGRLTDSLPNPSAEQASWMHRIAENLATERTLLQDSRLLLSSERQPVVDWDRPARVHSLIREVASSFRADLDKKGIVLRLELRDDIEIMVDPQALSRVIANLLGNAMKTTPPGGTITVGSRLEGETVVFRVSDTGGGFTREQAAVLSRGWDDFDRGVNPPGLWGGLGLLICHSIVLRYGGILHLASDGSGRGSTFSFGIRVAPLPTSSAATDLGGASRQRARPSVHLGRPGTSPNSPQEADRARVCP